VPLVENPQYLGIEWDAENRLLAINQGTLRSEFMYDGLDRRVRMVEKVSGVVQSDTRVLWCESEVCEERQSDGATVARRIFARGEQVAGAARFFVRDHLASVSEVTDSNGSLIARYAFDPWGRRTLVAGSDVTTIGFTGHRWQANAGLWLALHRGYDPSVGRWLNTDPLGFVDGPNMYRYARNNPVRYVDRTGTDTTVGVEYYRHPTAEDVQKVCPPGSYGCTKASAEVFCDCEKRGCWYYPVVWMDVTIRVHFVDDPRAFDNEWAHVEQWLSLVDKLSFSADNFEHQPFPSYSTCLVGCVAFIAGVQWHWFLQNFWQELTDPW
jgi:RHS repeat-associated protein